MHNCSFRAAALGDVIIVFAPECSVAHSASLWQPVINHHAWVIYEYEQKENVVVML